jgi:hypothetical protein
MQCGSAEELGEIRYCGIKTFKIIMRPVIAFILCFTGACTCAQNVFSTQYANQADLNVFVVDYENQCDLKVFKVDYSNQAKGNQGLWYFVEYGNQADKKVFFAEYANQSDLKIFFVKYKNQAGWRDKTKQHLLY